MSGKTRTVLAASAEHRAIKIRTKCGIAFLVRIMATEL
jgi:hypothetical protein